MARRFTALRQAGNYITKRLFGIGRDEQTFGLGQVYGTQQESYNRLKTYKGAVYACINLIAESVGAYKPIIYEEKADGTKDDIGKHPLLELLANPGGYDDKALPITQFSLLYATASFIELQGDVYWYLPKGKLSGQPREIVILRADKVGRNIDDEGEITSFFVIGMGGRKVQIEIDEMLPFVGFDPENPYQGIGTVQAAIEYIHTDEFSTLFTKNFFKNNAGISGVLSVGGDLAKTAFKKFVRAWREKYQGVDNAGKVMIVRGSDAAKFEKVGLGLNELDMSALRKMSLEDIAMMFRVPLPLLGKILEGTGLGRGNIETLEYIFAKYNIDKKLTRIDQVLQFALQRYWPEQSKNMKVGHANIIPEDKDYKLNERDKGVDRWITRNEIRAQDGMDDVEGGDELRTPIASIPISEDLSAADTASATSGKSATVKFAPLVLRISMKRTVATGESADPQKKKILTLKA